MNYVLSLRRRTTSEIGLVRMKGLPFLEGTERITERTRPSLLNLTSETRAMGQLLRLRFLSFMMTMSPGVRDRWIWVLNTPVTSPSISLDIFLSKTIQGWRVSLIFEGQEHCRSQRKRFIGIAWYFPHWRIIYNGRSFLKQGIQVITVEFFGPIVESDASKIRLKEPILCSQTPPKWLALGGLRIHSHWLCLLISFLTSSIEMLHSPSL